MGKVPITNIGIRGILQRLVLWLTDLPRNRSGSCPMLGPVEERGNSGPADKSVRGETYGKLVVEREPLRIEKLDNCRSRCRFHP